MTAAATSSARQSSSDDKSLAAAAAAQPGRVRKHEPALPTDRGGVATDSDCSVDDNELETVGESPSNSSSGSSGGGGSSGDGDAFTSPIVGDTAGDSPGDVEVNRPTTDGAGAERGSGVGGGSSVADVLRTPTPSRPLRPERDVEVGDTVSPLRPARASVPPGVLVANGSLSDTRALVGAAGSTTAKKDKKKKGASTKGMVASVGMNINAKITLEDEVHDEVEVEVKVKSSGGGRSRVRSLAKSTNSQSGSRKRRRHAAPIATMVADSEDEDEEDEEKDDIDEQKEDEVVEEEVLAIPTSVAVSPPPPGSEDPGVQTGEKNAKKKKKKKKKMNKSRAHMPKAKLWCRGQPLDCGHIVYAQDLQEIWLAARIIELALPDDVNGYKVKIHFERWHIR